jgi:hypothetical protein
MDRTRSQVLNYYKLVVVGRPCNKHVLAILRYQQVYYLHAYLHTAFYYY